MNSILQAKTLFEILLGHNYTHPPILTTLLGWNIFSICDLFSGVNVEAENISSIIDDISTQQTHSLEYLPGISSYFPVEDP